MADKLTQQITDGLARAAAHPDGLALYTAKSDPGLFPNTAAAKPAAQKCLADELIHVIRTETRGKTTRDLYTLTDKGWDYLLAQVNPRQVLEDFVRVLEERRGEVSELLDTARRMAESLQGLRDAVSRVLPVVSESRVRLPNPPVPFPASEGGAESPSPYRGGVGEGLPFPPNPPAPFPQGKGEQSPLSTAGRGLGEGSCLAPDPIPTAVAVLESEADADLAPAILARLANWSGPTDCTLPELYRSLALLDSPPTIGEFHDSLRRLHADAAVALHSWTGPLYAMPEPAYALLIGHGIAYYASLKSGQWAVGSGQ